MKIIKYLIFGIILFYTTIAYSESATKEQNSNKENYQNQDLKPEIGKIQNFKNFIKNNKLKNKNNLIKKFMDWGYYSFKIGNEKYCYLLSLPIQRDGIRSNMGEGYILVVNSENDVDQISVSSGFYYKEESDTQISFGSEKFYLFPFETYSWAKNKNDDIGIIKSMQRSSEFIISGIDINENIVNDKYSLLGFKKAYIEMKYNCFNNDI